MRHEVTKADNYLLVLDYKDVQPGDSFLLNFDHPSGRIRRCHRVCDNGREDLLMISPDGFGFSYRRECKRISAHIPLNGAPYLDGVDRLPPMGNGEDVDKLAREEILYNDDKREWWKQGYNKAREKYEFTKEDLRKAIIMSSLSSVDIQDNRCDGIIQSIQQPKLPIAFESEISNPMFALSIEPRKTTNSEGRTEWVGKYIYE
jgi:hypothetical protein